MCQTPLKEPLSVRPSTDPVPKRGVCEVMEEEREISEEIYNRVVEQEEGICRKALLRR